jgi:hypothetical protein
MKAQPGRNLSVVALVKSLIILFRIDFLNAD